MYFLEESVTNTIVNSVSRLLLFFPAGVIIVKTYLIYIFPTIPYMKIMFKLSVRNNKTLFILELWPKVNNFSILTAGMPQIMLCHKLSFQVDDHRIPTIKKESLSELINDLLLCYIFTCKIFCNTEIGTLL